MADYGVIIRNTSGDIVIDSTYANLYYAGTWEGAMTAGQEITINGGADYMLPFLSVTGAGYAGIKRQQGNSRSWTIRAQGSCNVRLYVYKHQTPPVDKYGIYIQDANGRAVFSSAVAGLRVLDFQPLTWNEDSGSDFSKQYSEPVAVCLSTPRMSYNGVTSYRTDGINTASNRVQVKRNITFTQQGPWADHTGVRWGGSSVNTFVMVAGVQGL